MNFGGGIMSLKDKNIEIFNDTIFHCRNNSYLKESIKESIDNQKLYSSETDIMIPGSERKEKASIIVSKNRSFAAAESYAKSGKKVCVLNFASSTNPGGGVVSRSSAQEESLCRCSTLYPCLNLPMLLQQFYIPHREKNDPLYNDDCIFTPNITVFKSDTTDPVLLPNDDWFQVDIITCAAPNLNRFLNVNYPDL